MSENILSDRYADGTYLAANADWHEGDAAWKADHVLTLMRREGLSPARVCDIGSGAGGVIAALHAKLPDTTDFTGYELSPQAHAMAVGKARPRLTYLNRSVLDDDAATYDLALMMDVFEHVDDYLGFLRAVRRKARHFIFHVPLDISALSVLREWPILRKRQDVGHIHYFTRAIAIAVLEDCGYVVKGDFLTHAAMQPPPRGLKAQVRTLPARTLFSVSPDLCARLLGGCAVMIHAEGTPATE